MRRLALFVCLSIALSAQAHEGCFQNPQLAVILIAFQARQATEAQKEETRYWEAARQSNPEAKTLIDAAEAISEGGRKRYCEAVAAPHAAGPMQPAIQWECEARWSRSSMRRIWVDFLRSATPPTTLPEPIFVAP